MEEEMQLLNKGLKYNLHYKPKNWTQTVSMEVDIGIKQLPIKEQNYMRQIVANNIQKLENKQYSRKEKNRTERAKLEWWTMKTIQQKIQHNQLIVTKADKGNTLIIVHRDEYN
jgi:hypothetical protein